MEIVSSTIFYTTAALAIFGVLGIIFTHKSIYALMYALLTFFSVGCLFMSLEMQYLAAVQITLFSALTLILTIILLMITKQKNKEEIVFKPRLLTSIFSLCIMIFIIVIFIKYGAFFNEHLKSNVETLIIPTSQNISIEMFINYGAAFIFTALAFLAGIIGIGVFAQPVRRGKK